MQRKSWEMWSELRFGRTTAEAIKLRGQGACKMFQHVHSARILLRGDSRYNPRFTQQPEVRMDGSPHGRSDADNRRHEAG
jgi:hypothetical protein